MTLIKGAFVAFTPTFLPVPIPPNVIIFQFNPESLTHTWSQPSPSGGGGGGGGDQGMCGRPGTQTGNPLAVPGMPGEQFSLTVAFDAQDEIADGGPSGALAEASGVYTRLAALEMLLYPSPAAGSILLGQVSSALFGGGRSDVKRTVPDSTLPITLFVWGAFRIVPVRVTGLTITETLYDNTLNPIYAEAKLEMHVTTPAELHAAESNSEVLAKLASVAYLYTLGLRQAGALANLGNIREVIGLLPH